MNIPLVRPHYGQVQITPDADAAYAKANEQTDYLEGVLWSDPARRLDPEANPDDIDPYGTGTAAFWRGFIEVSGYVGLVSNGENKYPRVQLRASVQILNKFLEFMQEWSQAPFKWDEKGTYHFQAGAGKITVTGTKAQDTCKALYPPDSHIGLESIRATVDEIISWVPRI